MLQCNSLAEKGIIFQFGSSLLFARHRESFILENQGIKTGTISTHTKQQHRKNIATEVITWHQRELQQMDLRQCY